MNPFRSWLGALNFVVLQWFGVRLARVIKTVTIWHRSKNSPLGDPREVAGLILQVVDGDRIELVELPVGWKLLRWIVPLTGWWSDYRYIARRPKP